MISLPVIHAAKIDDRPKERRWLVEDLWIDEGVGIIGGQPKCCKSFLALDMAVAVASGKPCLRGYAVARRGRVLLYCAEDALDIVKKRLTGICNASGCDLNEIDIQVITAPVLRLDKDDHRGALTETVQRLQPKLLVLDPFIRMHRIDENNSGEVAAILAYLRVLNRTFKVAVALVHHASKRSNIRAGQALRGSSEFHAWGDSNLYLQRGRDDALRLTVEHRSETSRSGVALELHEQEDSLALRQVLDVSSDCREPTSNEDKVYEVIRQKNAALSLEQIRAASHIRRNTVCDIIKTLVQQGKVIKSSHGYQAT